MSCPAGILICAWCRQVVTGSPQASTVYVHRPGSPAVTSAPQRSVPGASSRIGVQGPGRPSGSRRTTFAATASWPSRKTVAEIWNDSPVTALAGLRPFRTIGRTSSTGIRPTAVALPEGRFGAGADRRPEPREDPEEAPGRPEAACALRAAPLALVVGGTAGWCLAGMTASCPRQRGCGRMSVGRSCEGVPEGGTGEPSHPIRVSNPAPC
ncbi:hypothetical protein STXM2123_4335 [Streptomyces sp. F-3]|nr:hypothetical protein STXM2123_4335 [Streptomyces sp. F-3]